MQAVDSRLNRKDGICFLRRKGRMIEVDVIGVHALDIRERNRTPLHKRPERIDINLAENAERKALDARGPFVFAYLIHHGVDGIRER